MKDASAGDIPAPQCPVTQGNENYQGKKKKSSIRIRALPEVRDLHRQVSESMDLPSPQQLPKTPNRQEKGPLLPMHSPPLSNRTMQSTAETLIYT